MILQLLDQGESTTAIASALFVAPVTVRSHILALSRKLSVRNREEAVALFRSQRLGQEPRTGPDVEPIPTPDTER